MNGTLGTVVVGVLVIGGSLFFLVSAVAMLRTRDAISRVNSMSPATGMGLPLILVGALVHDAATYGWSWENLVKVLLAIAAALVVSSVASNILGRAAYRTAPDLDPHTVADALRDTPGQDPGTPRG